MKSVFVFPPIRKHQAGKHDQESHGSWAGETAGELTDDEIREIIYSADTVEHAFQKIAKKLGKSMKPRVADSFKVAGTPVYRGVQDVTRDAQRLLDGKIRYTDFQTYGQGIYVTEKMSIARNYGDIISMKLDDSAKMLRGESEWDNSFKFDYENPTARTRGTTSSKFLDLNKIKMKKWAPADIRNLYLASKGYDGAIINSEILLFNADKLTVNEEDIGEAIRKHQAGQHDQETHGSWATGSDGVNTNYRMSHRAPDPEENAPAYDLTGGGAIYPDNVYSADGARIYGGGEPEMARRVHSIITSMRGNPNAKVQIYRAVPKGVRQVNVGDWVTIDRQYAEQHGQSNLNNDYEILTNTVNADEIYTDGNSLFEWSYYPRVQKHLAGQHDQRTHGSWAGGGAGVDITADVDKLFYNPDGSVNKETQDVIEQMNEKEIANGHRYGDNGLKIIAERQGFTGKPKTVSTVAELKQLQEAEGGTIVYRGISEWRRLETTTEPYTATVITYTAEQAVEQFKRGEYYAGWGAFGTGTYTTIRGDEASSYANDYDESEDIYGNGKVMAIHIPKNAKMPTQQQVKSAMEMVNYDDGPNVTTYKQNVARILAAQGFQVYNAGLLQDDKKDYFVILDRSMLTVADQDWTLGL